MSSNLKQKFAWLVPVADVVFAPLLLPASVLMRTVRRKGIARMPISRSIFRRVGVFPIWNHYYEPLFETSALTRSLESDRVLPGLDLNVEGQLSLLSEFTFQAELDRFPTERAAPPQFYYHNGNFESGDAEILYNMIRRFRPSRIIEIGSGNSTLIAHAAIAENTRSDPSYRCEHICIEPYDHPWLESLPIRIIRERVEKVPLELFEQLGHNDILFIDSSHVIRPQGDVLFEFQEVLPRVKPGVLVQIHDIFTPRDYPTSWVVDHVRLWNEQYLVESFLAFNDRFQIIAALNFLAHHHPAELGAACPVFGREAGSSEPASLWVRRVA